jgi:hypothetical protein
MEVLKNTGILQTKRKTTSNIKNNYILISNSKHNLNFLSANNFDLDNILNDYEELNGIDFTDKLFRRKVTSRRSFLSKIPPPNKNCQINVGRKYQNFDSKLF